MPLSAINNINRRHDDFAERSFAYGLLPLDSVIREARSRQSAAIGHLLRRGTARIADFVKRFLIDLVVRHHRRNVLYREMSSMDTRVLTELGVSRHDIHDVVEGTYGRGDNDTDEAAEDRKVAA